MRIACGLVAVALIGIAGCSTSGGTAVSAGPSSGVSAGPPGTAPAATVPPATAPPGSSSIVPLGATDPLTAPVQAISGEKQITKLSGKPAAGVTIGTWVLLAISPDRRQLLVEHYLGACDRLLGFYVEEGTTTVVLGDETVRTTPAKTACPALEMVARGEITLDRPLGVRALVHAR